MKISLFSAFILAATSSLALADGSLASKAQMDHPGASKIGTTLNPTTNPDDRSLSAKAMRDHPGVRG